MVELFHSDMWGKHKSKLELARGELTCKWFYLTEYWRKVWLFSLADTTTYPQLYLSFHGMVLKTAGNKCHILTLTGHYTSLSPNI